MIDHITKVKPKGKDINLVLSGTGALYPLHAGAVCALIDLGYNVKSISATSGGAIVGSCVAAGVPPEKIKRVVVNYNPWKVLLRKPKIPLKNGWGFFDNQPLISVLRKAFGDTTFQSAKIPIEIVATELYPSFGRYAFNRMVSPELTLAEACRISSAIPIVFKNPKYKSRVFIDGSFSDDLPIKPFEDDFANTIALNVQVKSTVQPKTFWEFLRFCLSMIINDQGHWKYTPKDLTLIPIEVYKYSSPLQFNLTREDRKNLFQSGYNQVISYLSDI